MKSSTSLPPILRALEQRNYRLFFFGQFFSLIGTWMQTVAQGWLVLRLTDSAFSLGVVAAASALPIVCFSFFAGQLADQFPKRQILLLTQCVAAILSLALCVLTLTNVIQYWQIIALAFLLGCANAFEAPARQAFAIEIAGHSALANAIALNSFIFNGSRMIGPALAGVLVAWLGEGLVFGVNALSFLALIYSLLRMEIPDPVLETQNAADLSLRDAIAYLETEPSIAALLALAAGLSLFGFSYSPLMPLFVREVLNGDARALGFLSAASGVGAVIGSLTIAWQGTRLQKWPWITASAAVFPMALFALSFMTSLHWAVVANGALGWAGVTSMVLTNSRIQTTVPNHLRARIMSFYTWSILGLGPAGSIVLGWLVHRIGGIEQTFFLSSSITLVCIGCVAVILFRQDSFHEHDSSRLRTTDVG